MPELPEVETIKRDLASVLVNQRINYFKVNKPKLLRNKLIFFNHYLLGAKILSVKRRAKLLLIELSSGYYLIIHLKMTGQLVWRGRAGGVKSGGHPIVGVSKVPNKYTYITLGLLNGSKLFYNDVRQFGYWQLVNQQEIELWLSKYGPEPLSSSFTLSRFIKILKKRSRSKIKSVLLDQKVVAGLGNIYVDESLFLARIKPDRQVAELKLQQLRNLHRSIKQVLRRAIMARGTSFSNYVDALGKNGSYWQNRYVYGRTDEPCRRCGRAINKTIIAGRGTHYCAQCQF